MEDEGPETFSKDSPRLQFQSPSSRIPWGMRAVRQHPQLVRNRLHRRSETEWKEGTEEAAMCP